MSDEDGVFGLQFICSVKMMSINWGAFSIIQIESILSQNTLTSSFCPVN